MRVLGGRVPFGAESNGFFRAVRHWGTIQSALGKGAHRIAQPENERSRDGQLANFLRELFPGFRENLGSLERAT